MIRSEVRKILSKDKPDKVEAHGLYIGESEIGRCKLECDAVIHMRVINEAMDHNESEAEQAGYNAGYQAGIDFVATGE